MSEQYTIQLQELATALVTPERYGRVALQTTVELPEHKLVFGRFPETDGQVEQ